VAPTIAQFIIEKGPYYKEALRPLSIGTCIKPLDFHGVGAILGAFRPFGAEKVDIPGIKNYVVAHLMKKKKPTKRRLLGKKNAKIPVPKFFLRFQNVQLKDAALLHPSYLNENPNLPIFANFDRLEFFGDSVLNFVICRKLYREFPDADEGLLSRLRSILVSRKILARIAREIGLPQFLHLGRGLASQEDFHKAKMFADAFEALIAALYFDQGFDRTERFLLKCFSGYFDMKKLFRLDPNPKSTLQELAQRHWQKLPSYSSQNQDAGFKAVVSISPRRKAQALGRNRQEAEERAARLLIRALRQELVKRLKRASSGRKLRRTF
jgi:ribonuclease-3